MSGARKLHFLVCNKEIIMIINHNMSSLYAQRMEGINTHNVQKSIEKLSSGLRLNAIPH